MNKRTRIIALLLGLTGMATTGTVKEEAALKPRLVVCTDSPECFEVKRS